MSMYDLTTLAALKAWLGLPASASPNDATLSALITAGSRAIYALLSRPGLLPRSYSETIDGESRRLFLRHWPVLQIASVTMDGFAIPPATPAARTRGRLSPQVRRRRAAGTPAGARHFRMACLAAATEPRNRL